jgi:hypothetical protein
MILIIGQEKYKKSSRDMKSENIAKIVKELRNGFEYKINTLIYRAWPDLTYLPNEKHDETIKK